MTYTSLDDLIDSINAVVYIHRLERETILLAVIQIFPNFGRWIARRRLERVYDTPTDVRRRFDRLIL